jgi:hypothetical protein
MKANPRTDDTLRSPLFGVRQEETTSAGQDHRFEVISLH